MRWMNAAGACFGGRVTPNSSSISLSVNPACRIRCRSAVAQSPISPSEKPACFNSSIRVGMVGHLERGTRTLASGRAAFMRARYSAGVSPLRRRIRAGEPFRAKLAGVFFQRLPRRGSIALERLRLADIVRLQAIKQIERVLALLEAFADFPVDIPLQEIHFRPAKLIDVPNQQIGLVDRRRNRLQKGLLVSQQRGAGGRLVRKEFLADKIEVLPAESSGNVRIVELIERGDPVRIAVTQTDAVKQAARRDARCGRIGVRDRGPVLQGEHVSFGGWREVWIIGNVGPGSRRLIAHQIGDDFLFGLIRHALNVLPATDNGMLRILQVIFLLLPRLLDQGIFHLLRKLAQQRVAALGRLKLADRPRGIAAAHSGILAGAKRKGAASLLLQGLLGSEKSPRDRVVYGGMQGIDAAGEQGIVRVEGAVLYEIVEVPFAARRVGAGGAAKRLVVDRGAFLRERRGEFGADVFPQAFI